PQNNATCRCFISQRCRAKMATQRSSRSFARFGSERRTGLWDADTVGPAAPDGAASDGLQGFAHADLDSGKVVVAATEGEAVTGDGGVGLCEKVKDLARRHGDRMVERGEPGGNDDAAHGLASEVEKSIRSKAGAGAMSLPLVTKESRVGI